MASMTTPRQMGSGPSSGSPSLNPNYDPYWLPRQQAPLAPEAYGIARDILGAGGSYSMDFTAPAYRLNTIGGSEHPGMSDAELRGVLGGIDVQAQKRRGDLANTVSRFGGSVDPESYMRASRGLNADVMGAYQNAYTSQISADRDALMQATQALSPYASESARMGARQQGELNALAGNIMGSGDYRGAPSYGIFRKSGVR